MAKKVTIYTISKELGLSPGTVSRALSNHPSISAATRARVKPVAEKYNFKPRVVSNKPLNICMVIQKFQGHPLGIDEYVALTMEGIAEYCHDENLELSIYSGFADEMNKCDIVRELRSRTADGAIILRSTDDSDYIKQMSTQKFPYFCLSHQVDDFADQGLSFDPENMGYKATEYLLGLGHRRIGILCDSMDYVSVIERYNGYIRALKEYGLLSDKKLVYSKDIGANSYKSVMSLGAEGIEVLMSRCPDMTAVFAIDDKIAYGALSWLYVQGISVPKDISIVGLSDYPASNFSAPPLTTVHVPHKEIGYESARQVHRLCRNLDICIKPETLKTITPEIVVRNSCKSRQ